MADPRTVLTPSPETAVSMPEADNGKNKPKQRMEMTEQEKKELASMKASDHPRIRKIFDLLDASARGEPLPEGVKMAQGDLVAPGLTLQETLFPQWFHDQMVQSGWSYERGSASFLMAVGETDVEVQEGEQTVVRHLTAKEHAELWYDWLVRSLQSEAQNAAKEGREPLYKNVGIYIREDHTELLKAVISEM